MTDTRERLVELIKQAARVNGCSESQLEQILALVKTTFEEGVPEVDDLKRTLQTLGGSN
jgi:hypothetical protein